MRPERATGPGDGEAETQKGSASAAGKGDLPLHEGDASAGTGQSTVNPGSAAAGAESVPARTGGVSACEDGALVRTGSVPAYEEGAESRGGNVSPRGGNTTACGRHSVRSERQGAGRRRYAGVVEVVPLSTERRALPTAALVLPGRHLTARTEVLDARTEALAARTELLAARTEALAPDTETPATSEPPAARPGPSASFTARHGTPPTVPAGAPAAPRGGTPVGGSVGVPRRAPVVGPSVSTVPRPPLPVRPTVPAGRPPAARTGPSVSPDRIGVVVAETRAQGATLGRAGWRGAVRGASARVNSPAVRTHFGTAAGVAILTVLLWRLGTGVFLDGLRRIDAPTLLLALGIGLLTTVFSAWRWALVARGLGIRLPLVPAVADYYRALFLNAALPGGVLGDVHRAVRHGQSAGDLGRGVRAVVLERAAGQVVLAAVGAGVLLTMPSPVRSDARHLAPLIGLAALGALAVVVAVRMNRAPSRRGRALRAGLAEAREGLLSRRNGPGVAVSSAVVLAGHLGMFVLAARVTGSAATVAVLLPLAVLALLAMGLPLNVGGFGPREGVTAWAFGAAGLGASSGLAVAVVYGVLSFVAALPGALVLVARWYTGLRGAGTAGPEAARPDPAAGTVVPAPAAHGLPEDGGYSRPLPAAPSARVEVEVSIEKYVEKESAKLASSSFPFSAEPREGRPMTPESV
jgi:uncharacterized membrane protein YbhN (UPF0104 family)